MMKKIQLNKNAIPILLSILVSVILWYYVTIDLGTTLKYTYSDIDVLFEGTANLRELGLSLKSPESAKVSVQVEGTFKQLRNITKDSIRASVDLSKLDAGSHKMDVKINVPGNAVKVVQITPPDVDFVIENIIEVDSKVAVKTEGDLRSGYVLGTINNEPTVKLTGPRSEVDKVARVLAYIDLEDKAESYVANPKVVALDSEGNEVENVNLVPQNVDVEIPILKTKTVPIKLNIYGDLEANSIKTVATFPNSVAIKGNTAIINNIYEINTRVVSLGSVLNGEVKFVELNLPDGITIVDDTQNYEVVYTLNEENNEETEDVGTQKQ